MSDWKSRAQVVTANAPASWRDRAEVVAEEPQGTVLNEASPDIDWSTRTIAKTLGNSPETMAAYIRQEHPGLDVQVIEGEVVAKRPGEAEFRKLDPSTLEWSDVTDLLDVPVSGAMSTLGMVGGATAGALAGVPTGGAASGPLAAGGAVAGNAAGSAMAEYLRQRLGKAAGIPQEVNPVDVAISGGLGAAGVGLLGTGPMKGIAQTGQVQGAIRAGWNRGMPAMTRMWTGVSQPALDMYVDPATRGQVQQLAKGGRSEFTDDLTSRITAALNAEKQSVGEQLRTSIDGAGDMVNIADAKAPFRSELAALKQTYRRMPTPENKAAVDAAEQTMDSLFANVRQGPRSIEIPESGDIKTIVDTDTFPILRREAGKYPIGFEDQTIATAPGYTKYVPVTETAPIRVRDSEKLSKLGLPTYRDEVGVLKSSKPVVVPPEFEVKNLPIQGPAEPVYVPGMETRNVVRKEMGPNVVVQTRNEIPSAVKPSDAWLLQQQLKDYGDLRRISGGLNPRYSSQASSSEKSLADQALTSYQKLGEELGRVTEGASPEFKKQYSELADMQSILAPSLRTDQSAYSTFTNMDGKSKVMFKETLDKLGLKSKQDFTTPVNMLQAADYFGQDSWVPRSIGGTTSTTRTGTGGVIGGILGYKLGQMMGSPAAGATAGAFAGSASSSPNALKMMIHATDPLRQGANAVSPYLVPATDVIREGAVRSPWFDMKP